MMPQVDLDKARAFVRRKSNVLERAIDWYAYLYWQWLPRWFDGQFTVNRLLFNLGLFAIVASIALQPIWSKTITDEGLKFDALVSRDYWLSGIVLGLLLFRSIFERVLGTAPHRRRIVDETYHLSLAQGDLFKKLRNQVFDLRRQSSAQHNQQVAQESILKCVENVVILATRKNKWNYFSVNLFIFSGDGGERADLIARSHSGRDLRTDLCAPNLIAFYVAEAQKPFTVNNFGAEDIFPRVSPGTNVRPPYRSILLLPVLNPYSAETRGNCKAVVTIDSDRPYEFWGSVSTDIEVLVSPYLRLIDLLLSNHTGGVQFHE